MNVQIEEKRMSQMVVNKILNQKQSMHGLHSSQTNSLINFVHDDNLYWKTVIFQNVWFTENGSDLNWFK